MKRARVIVVKTLPITNHHARPPPPPPPLQMQHANTRPPPPFPLATHLFLKTPSCVFAGLEVEGFAIAYDAALCGCNERSCDAGVGLDHRTHQCTTDAIPSLQRTMVTQLHTPPTPPPPQPTPSQIQQQILKHSPTAAANNNNYTRTITSKP